MEWTVLTNWSSSLESRKSRCHMEQPYDRIIRMLRVYTLFLMLVLLLSLVVPILNLTSVFFSVFKVLDRKNLLQFFQKSSW